MINVDEHAQEYFRGLIEQEGGGDLALRLEVVEGGTPRADCDLSFCPPEDAKPDDIKLQLEGLVLYIADDAKDYLKDAEISYEKAETGGNLKITAPNIKGVAPADDASLFEQVRYFLNSEINPALAAHRGMCELVDITEDNRVVLRFGGGCQGCSMIDVTVKQGIEQQLIERFPSIAGVEDATNHAMGDAPYFS